MLMAVVDDDRLQAQVLADLIRRSAVMGHWGASHSMAVVPAGDVADGSIGREGREGDTVAGHSFPSPHGVGCLDIRWFPSADDFERFCKNGTAFIDVVFMDIRLNGANGIDVVSRLFPRGSGTQIVYVTGYDDYHTKVYATQHAGFIVKPITQENVDSALESVLARRDEVCERPILVPVGREAHVVIPRDIVYAEKHLRVLIIHMKYGDVTTYLRIPQLMTMLPDRFVQCHQSFLVNLDYLAKWAHNTLYLSDGTQIPVSQRQRSATRRAVLAYMRSVR